MKFAHAMEGVALDAAAGALRMLPWRTSMACGAALGGAVRALGVRVGVARDNLRRAFPGDTDPRREAILSAHYRELGRIVSEYTRLGELVRAPGDETVVRVHGLEHLERARAAGRGAILLSGHFGNVELLGAWLGKQNPVAFVVRPLSNPRAEAWIASRRREAGVEIISANDGVRGVFDALRANRWVAMLADQDARRHGVFVPFFGVPASTALGPARIALRAGAPIVMGFATRCADGRHELHVEPPLAVDEPRAPDAAARLTARHVALLETWIRRHPEAWFWLHRRWKTRPRAAA